MKASLGCNLEVADSNLMIVKVVILGEADAVAGHDASSQSAYSDEQSGPFFIDGYSVALVVDFPNAVASFRRTEFDGPDEAIKSFEAIFGRSILAILVSVAHRCKCNMVILQTSCLELAQRLQIRGRIWFAAERTK